MGNDGILRLRCPRDIADPSHPERHLAIDVRTPISRIKRDFLADSFGDCSCGTALIILKHSRDPWARS